MLTPTGRSALVKSTLSSILAYQLTVLNFPKWVIIWQRGDGTMRTCVRVRVRVRVRVGVCVCVCVVIVHRRLQTTFVGTAPS